MESYYMDLSGSIVMCNGGKWTKYVNLGGKYENIRMVTADFRKFKGALEQIEDPDLINVISFKIALFHDLRLSHMHNPAPKTKLSDKF